MRSEREGVGASPALRRTVAELGPEAERWLAGVPALVAEIATAWDLDVGPALAHEGAASIVLPATTDQGVPAVLKLSVPHDESRHEADALARWDGDGAVSLLRSSEEGFTLLLERCQPGHDLWAASIDQQIAVMADLLPRLWAPEPDGPFQELAETAAHWERQMLARATAMGVPGEVARRARRWAHELAEDQPRRLLHGDLHPGNVLAARRQPWLAIDATPWVGDPAFDLAQTLVNWIRVDRDTQHDAVGAIRLRAGQLAERLSLEVDRVLRWAVVKAIGWDVGREEALVLDEAATRSP